MKIEMDPVHRTKNRANHLGVKLEVPKDRDVIVASPKERITDELADLLRANRKVLMRDLLMEQATRYLADRWINACSSEPLHPHVERISEAYPPDKPFTAYRAAVREYVKAGLKEIARAKAEAKRSSHRRAS